MADIVISKVKLPNDNNTYHFNRKAYFGTCETAAGTAAKVVTLTDGDGFALKAGVIIGVKFTNNNTATNVTLNVNESGNKSIWYGAAVITVKEPVICGTTSAMIYYMYNGTYWCWMGYGYWQNTDTKVRQTLATGNANRPLLMAYSDNTVTTSNVDNVAYRNNSIYANPSTGTITATTFAGDASTVSGGHTVAKDVPSDAVFTDTTYTGTGVISVNSSTHVISTTAEVNQNAFSNIKVGSTTVAADTKTDTLELVADKGIELTPDATNDKVTITNRQQGIYAVIGTQTTSTGSWTGVLHGVPALYDGLTIMYYLPWAGSGNATLNLTLDDGTTTGAVNCYYHTSRLTTHYAKGSNIIMTYWSAGSIKVDGTATTDNRWIANANYDTNDQAYQVRDYYNRFKVGANKVFPYTIIMQCADDRWESIVTSSSTGTSKTRNTHGFKLGQIALMYANATYNENATISDANIWESYTSGLVDHRYSFNTANNSTSGTTAVKPVYLVGALNAIDGLFYLDATWWTQTLPTTDDGKLYIYLGDAYDYYRMSFVIRHPIYWYKNGAVRQFTQDSATVTGHTVAKDVPSSANFNDTTYSMTRDGANVKLTPSNGTAQTVGLSDLINGLATGSSTPVDADYYVSQYVNGGTTTTSYHRRPMSALWAYVKGKIGIDSGSTFLKKDGTWGTPTNTTYTFTNGGTNKFTVTPSGGTAQDVTFTASDSTKVAKTGDSMSGDLKFSATGKGIYLKDSASTEYAGIFDNGSNLWIGATSSTGAHHKGSTYISAGLSSDGVSSNPSIYVSKPTKSGSTYSSTQYLVAHAGNVGTGDSNGQVKIAGTNVSVKGLAAGAYKAVDTAVTSGSANLVTSGAVYTAIDNLPEPMVFKGSLGTGGTITALPVNGTANIGDTYKVITAGTYASQSAKVGDTFICDSKTSSANTWTLIPSGDEPSGTVTSVKINATSPIAIDSNAAITTSGERTISHANSGVTAGTYRSVTVNATGHVTAGTNPTTISGYGITDAKIASGTITLGSNTITPLTASSTLDATKLSGTIPTSCYTDTKNTAGSTDTSNKIFLIGATSQAANPQTYSDNEVYTTSGVLTTKSVQVGGTAATMQYNSTTQAIEFIFA